MKEFLIFFIIMFVLIIINQIIDNLFSNMRKNNDNTQNGMNTNKSLYARKPLMTFNENAFYNKIKILETNYNLRIVPQINMASFVEKMTNRNYYTDLFRNIDFGIYTSDYSTLLVLIELNDNSHKMKKRRKRDLKVKSICDEIGVPLLTFYTTMPNEQNYVLNRILTTINSPTQENK